MNWAFKYAFREIDELYKNRPWLLVDDSIIEHQNDLDEQGDSFLSVQKELMLQRGWDWFRTVIRGRFFPNLNVTTVTTLEAERNPKIGDPQEVIEQVRQKFPGVTLVSLIGKPHVIEGTGFVPPDMLLGILSHASQQKWHANLEKTSDVDRYAAEILQYKLSHGTTSKYAADKSRLEQMLSAAWPIPASLGAGAVLAWLLSLGILPVQIEQQVQNGATIQQVINQAPQQNPSFEEGNTQFPADNADFAENTENSVETLDNAQETTRMSREVDTRNLDGLDPMFAEKVKQVLATLAEKGWQPRVASGLRSIEQQQEKIDQGTSSLKAPQNSKHVQGLAADIIDSRYGWEGKASDLNFQFWNDLGQAAKEVGLVWGGDWKSFKDVAHVEAQTNTTGASVAVYRHAYQGIDWVEAKEFVKQLADRGFLWYVKGGPCVIDELQKAGVSDILFRRLKPVYDKKTNNAWSHTYVKLGRV